MARFANISILSFEHYRPKGTETGYEDYKNNIKAFLQEKIDKVLVDNPDLIILPENCNRVDEFSIKERYEYYTYVNDDMQAFMAGIAKKNKVNIAYAAARVVDDKTHPFRNSIIFYDRAGEVAGIYDKNHLVPAEYDDYGIGYGDVPQELIKLDIGTIAPVICFDLNFDPLLEQYIKLKPDLIVFASAFYGKVIQDIWAYRCRSYFAGAIGMHQNGRIITPFGEVIARTTDNTHYATCRINLDYEICHIDENTERFEDAKRKYGEGFMVRDPGGVGCVIAESRMDGISIDDIIEEFGIERMDEYFDRSLKHRIDNYRVE